MAAIADGGLLPAGLGRSRDGLSGAARRGLVALARHWLALANGVGLLLLAGSVAVPGMMAVGLSRPAEPLFAAYRLVCHQLPYHSFFLWGQQMPVCQRDVAIYAALVVAGLSFGMSQRRWKPLPWRWYLLLLLPIALDGVTQLLGLRESNWQLRLITGALLGIATVGLAYPYLEGWSQEILRVEGSH